MPKTATGRVPAGGGDSRSRRSSESLADQSRPLTRLGLHSRESSEQMVLSWGEGPLGLSRSPEPADPQVGQAAIWMSNGTGFGDDGQVIIKTNVSGTITNLVISLSGETNQNAFTTVSLSGNTSGDTTIEAESKTDTLNIVAGSNVTLTGAAGTDTVTVAAAAGGGSDNYVESLAFATGTGVLTVGRTGALADLTQDLDGRYIQIDGTVALTGNWDAGSFYIQAETLRSDVADGTPPLVVTSTTKVDNLNADELDGNHASAFQPNDTDLTAIAGLSSADDNFIVGSAGGWVVESGATARTSLGITFGIGNTHTLRVDDADAVDNDYAKFTATGIEGRSYAEVLTDLGIGTVLANADTLSSGRYDD